MELIFREDDFIMANKILKKTHKKSFMKLFHVSSRFAETIFRDGGMYVTLQIMEISDQELIAELIDKEEYEKEGV